MGKNVIIADVKATAIKEKNLLTLELSEIKDISELIFKKLEKKIQAVEALEAKVDKEISLLQQLIQREGVVVSPSASETTLDSKIEVLKDMIRRSEAAGSQALAALKSSMERKLAECQQMVKQPETAWSRALCTLEAALDKKVSAVEGLIRHEEILQKKIQDVTSRESLIDRKMAILDQLLKKAGVLEQRMQNVESLEVSIDKKLGALELLARRVETVKSHWAGPGRQHEIIALRQKGLSTAEIAESLDMPQGEVDLTLELNAQQA